MENSQIIRIGVLTGGYGVEKEVSFSSGRTICDHLDTSIYKVIPIYQINHNELYILPWYFLHRGKTSDFESRLKDEAQRIKWDDLKSLVDFVYIAMHGRYAEDGTLQGMLEVLGIPHLGSSIFSSAVSMDRSIQRRFLKDSGIIIPKGFEVVPSQQYDIEFVLSKIKDHGLSFPLIVKPAGEGSSLGITLVENEGGLLGALHKAVNCDFNIRQPAIIEEKVEGMEFTAIFLQKKLAQIDICSKGSNLSSLLQHSNSINDDSHEWLALPLTEVIIEKNTKFYDYEQKYMPGRASKITPARCNINDEHKIKDVCLKVIKLLGLNTFTMIDGFLTINGEVIIIDINPLPGMTPTSFVFHQAAEIGMSHTQLINYLIEFELERYKSNKHLFSLSNVNLKNSDDISMNTKIKIAVFLGGDSNEKEISLDSGRNVCYKLSPKKYDIIPILVDDKMRLFKLSQRHLIQNSTYDIKMLLNSDSEIKWSDLPSLVDFVFLALHGGKGENGTIQGALDMLKIPYNGSGVFASSLCMDKYKTNDFLIRNGFEVPISKLIKKSDWNIDKESALKIINEFSFPLIVKPHNDGCSFYVKKIENMGELIKSIDEFFALNTEVIMVEEFIKGIELTCGVIGNDKAQALPPSMPIINNNILSIEEKFLPGAGENQTPAPLPEETLKLVMNTMERVYEAVGCKGYARIDCFYQPAELSPTNQDRVIILEINTLPGLTPATCIFHQAAEIDLKPMNFIDKIVQMGLELHNSNFNNKDFVKNSEKSFLDQANL